MKKFQVWRYQCDFCSKRGLSGGHMKTHEKHCTMNPDRVCRFHKYCEDAQAPMECLLLNLRQYGLKALRIVASECPVCILAAIRQSGLNVHDPETGDSPFGDFDFKKEMASKWQELNGMIEEQRSWQ